jgi:hypothetical protein
MTNRLLIVLVVQVDGPLAMSRSNRSVMENINSRAPPGHPEHTYHSFVAGAVGGYFVWGRYSAVNQQIVLYLASRVLVGMWNRAMQERRRRDGTHSSNDRVEKRQPGGGTSYPILAAAIWGIVMALWEESPNVLQSSLQKSMDEIYRHDPFQPRRQTTNSAAVTRLV